MKSVEGSPVVDKALPGKKAPEKDSEVRNDVAHALSSHLSLTINHTVGAPLLFGGIPECKGMKRERREGEENMDGDVNEPANEYFQFEMFGRFSRLVLQRHAS